MKNIDWTRLLYIVGYHIFLGVALPLFFIERLPPAGIVWSMIALVFATGIAITSGYHRLYSHQAYKAHPIVEVVLLFFATLATQGSALRWCYDHRLHHAFVDTDKDPYSVTKGFWHAHITWIFFKTDEIDPKVVADLYRNKLLVFQHKYYGACLVVASTSVFALFGWLFQDYWASFVFIWWLRTFLLHHSTWSINSLAHMWGTQAYSREHSAVDNYLISLITYGEGYHNYHHTFSNDYRNGIRWYHFDPGKWLIWCLNKVGLAKDLRQVNDFRILRQLVSDHKVLLVDKIKVSFYSHKDRLESRLTELNDSLVGKLSQVQSLIDRYKAVEKRERAKLIGEIRSAKKSLKSSWKEWKNFVKLLERGRVEKLV
ncbi:MAG: acyl-CoA desaturase [Verrucomicrobia bacterium]|nr:acyl-CoA desaturase [Verrucomicrobiota bacterium]